MVTSRSVSLFSLSLLLTLCRLFGASLLTSLRILCFSLFHFILSLSFARAQSHRLTFHYYWILIVWLLVLVHTIVLTAHSELCLAKQFDPLCVRITIPWLLYNRYRKIEYNVQRNKGNNDGIELECMRCCCSCCSITRMPKKKRDERKMHNAHICNWWDIALRLNPKNIVNARMQEEQIDANRKCAPGELLLCLSEIK